jgi:hypothetical protein
MPLSIGKKGALHAESQKNKTHRASSGGPTRFHSASGQKMLMNPACILAVLTRLQVYTDFHSAGKLEEAKRAQMRV